MATRTITVYDSCTKCGATLHSLREAEKGICSSCWFKEMPADTKKAMNRLIASAFNGATDVEKDLAIDDALGKLRRDEGK
jgi:hypothetical protein